MRGHLAELLVSRAWEATRRLVPPGLYPLLAPLYRWRRRHRIRQLEIDDRRDLAARPGLRAPPAELRYNVVGPCTISQFLESGIAAERDIENALRSVRTTLRDRESFLDFGCGCGRVAGALLQQWPHLRVTGCDVDQGAIAWCQANVAGASFFQNEALPPLPLGDATFDIAWSGSVFTHLDEERQHRWLRELHRVLNPDGLLVATVHGPLAWERRLPRWTLARLRRSGMIYAKTGADSGVHPDWYQVAWHTEDYVRRHWSSTFEIRAYIAGGAHGYQDIVIARKPGR